VSGFASATGIGSYPGSDARKAAEVVVGELHQLAHLVELPGRGIGADIIGRAGALLVDIGIDTVPRGYRIAPGRSAVARRAISLLGEDLDALEEAWETAGLRGSGRTVKVQAPGPITLAAHLELANGHRAITDSGALRDLTTSLAEGVAEHRATVARRLDAEVVVQFDEPTLPAALLGRLTGVTGVTPVHPVDEALATSLLDQCVAAVGVAVALHSCAADLDGIGEFVETGRVVMLGVVPSTAPDRRPSVEEVAKAAASITDRLGFNRSVLRDRIGVTPACGLAGATPQWARTAIELVQKVAVGFADDPEAV
jgi:methionine synthase II (cobalamin-independent)